MVPPLPVVGVVGAEEDEEEMEERLESTSMSTTWSWAPTTLPVMGLKERAEVGVVARGVGEEKGEEEEQTRIEAERVKPDVGRGDGVIGWAKSECSATLSSMTGAKMVEW